MDNQSSAPDPTGGLLTFLDHVESLADAARRRFFSYQCLRALPGKTIADIGCGAGTAARELAACVMPGGAVVGVDINEALITAAKSRAAQAAVGATFQVGDVFSLPFEASSLDGYRAERLYQHIPGPEKALAEALRVLKPGGRIVLVDQDWDTVVLDSDDLATTRTVQRAFSNGIVNCAVGRQYRRLLLDAGFVDVKVDAEVVVSTNFQEYGFVATLASRVADGMGALESAAAQRWLADQQGRGESGRFFMAMTHFVGSASKG